MLEDTKRTVVYDDFGRKIKTNHFTDRGTLDFTNSYFYEGDSKIPTKGIQVHFEQGKPIRITENIFDKESNQFIMTRISLYTSDVSLRYVNDYNLKGQQTEEKRFFKTENGFTWYRKKCLNPETGAITSDEEILHLNSSDLAITPEVKKIMNEYSPIKEQQEKKSPPKIIPKLLQKFFGKNH